MLTSLQQLTVLLQMKLYFIRSTAKPHRQSQKDSRQNSPSLSSLTSEVAGASDFQARVKSRSAFLEINFCISMLSTFFSFLRKKKKRREERKFMKTGYLQSSLCLHLFCGTHRPTHCTLQVVHTGRKFSPGIFCRRRAGKLVKRRLQR